MSNKDTAKEDMATILLLTCIVGSFCFLGFGSHLIDATNTDTAPSHTGALEKEQYDKQDMLEKLLADMERLKSELRRLQELMAGKQRMIEDLMQQEEKQRDEDSREQERLPKLMAEIASLTKEIERLKKGVQAHENPIVYDTRSFEEMINKKQEELKRTEEQIKGLTRSIEDKKASVDVGQLYGSHVGQQVQYVECVARGVILQPQHVEVALGRLKDMFEQHLANHDCVVFLVRPKGLQSFVEARTIVEGKGVKFGYEPVDDGWHLRYPGGN